MTNAPRTLYEKVWDDHVVVAETPDTPAVLYVDLHLIHEVTSPQAFDVLRERKLGVRRADKCLATMDHSTPTTPRDQSGAFRIVDGQASAQLERLESSCREHAIRLHALGDAGQGSSMSSRRSSGARVRA
jgi:3-isopropylmalate/(R)-2-methylmalate dehydratase large subunit